MRSSSKKGYIEGNVFIHIQKKERKANTIYDNNVA